MDSAANPPSRRPALRLLSTALVVVAVVWLSVLLVRDRDTLVEFFAGLRPVHVVWIAASVLVGALSNVGNLIIFRRFLALNSKVHYPWVPLTSLFFASQVVRYLPGRFWGVVYQIGELKKTIPSMAILRTNLDQMLFSLGINAIVSGSLVLAFWMYPAAGIAAFVAAAGLLLVVLHQNVPDRLLEWFGRRMPEKFSAYLEAARTREPYTLTSLCQLMLIKSVAWVVYLGAWVLLFQGLPGIAEVSPILLCGQYTLSWVLGFLSAFTPGGLGVREAVFVFLGTGTVSASALALLAILLRFWLMLVDLALFAAAALINRFYGPSPALQPSEP